MAPTVKVSSFDSPRFHVMLIDSDSLHVANGFSGVGQRMFHISVPFHMLLWNLWTNSAENDLFFDRRMKLD